MFGARCVSVAGTTNRLHCFSALTWTYDHLCMPYCQSFVEGRLKWRPQQPLTLLEVRAFRLQKPIDLKVRQHDAGIHATLLPSGFLRWRAQCLHMLCMQVHEELFGCFSFVDLKEYLINEPDLSMVEPALPDDAFEECQQKLRQGLQQVSHEELHL